MKALILCLLLAGCSTVQMGPFVAICAAKDAGQTDDGVPVVAMYCEPQGVK